MMKDKMSLKGNLQLAETNPGIGKKITRTVCKIKPNIHLFHWTIRSYLTRNLTEQKNLPVLLTQNWYDIIGMVLV